MGQQDFYDKIKKETQIEIDRLKMDLLVKSELTNELKHSFEEQRLKDSQLNKEYEKKLQEKINLLMNELTNVETKNQLLMKECINKEKEKYEALLVEKEKQNEKTRDIFERASVLINNKSMSKKGSDGEQKFASYADTFKDFSGFKLEDKHTQGGEGDFHMHFDEFDVLVDAKNYKAGVPSKEREKIKTDLFKNEHINFAWLVSLNTAIDKFDRSPIMFEWISTTKCVLYINNLSEYKEPTKLLRTAWFICKELCRFVSNNEETKNMNKSEISDELTNLKDKQFKINEKVRNMRKIIREINTSINLFKKQIDGLDYELKDILDAETTTLLDSNYAFIDNWWSENIELTNNSEDLLVSTDIWMRFRQDNREYIKDLDITPDKFRKFITSKLPMTCYELRGKGNSAIDIKFVSWNNKKVETKDDVIVDVPKETRTKKVVKKATEVKTESLKNAKVYLDVDIER